MKILRKEAILKRNQKIHTKAERDILENMSSPFIVQLHFAFQSPTKLYLIMDFMNGGTTRFLHPLTLIRRVVFPPEKREKV